MDNLYYTTKQNIREGSCYKMEIVEDIRDLYKVTDNLNVRVNELEKSKAVTDVQVSMIFKMLEEIKTSVGVIATEIKKSKEAPSIWMYSTFSAVVAGVVIIVVTKLMG